jgi:hypothetical protein
MRIRSRIRIQLKILMRIRVLIRGWGGRSAKNVHPPWQNPRYAPGYWYPTYPVTLTVHSDVYRNFMALLVPEVPCCFSTAVDSVLVFCNQAIHQFSNPKKIIRYSNYHGAFLVMHTNKVQASKERQVRYCRYRTVGTVPYCRTLT